MEKGSPYLGLCYHFNGSEGRIKLPRPRKYARSLDKPPNGLYPLEADPVYKSVGFIGSFGIRGGWI
jgi:hypothetical protein